MITPLLVNAEKIHFFLISYEFYRSSVEEINRHFFDQ